ncbi:hypothetical protein NDU88_001790 [Pleurodeles waltl]|uniref:Uncharacterized protein n=1 Tax=Pleurodeles waltl TaxID=8319 RepID=A0AAV7M1G8_PLEWA|nr:hypothetical protein NDU88_001790 [Pleurodeles waltl]
MKKLRCMISFIILAQTGQERAKSEVRNEGFAFQCSHPTGMPDMWRWWWGSLGKPQTAVCSCEMAHAVAVGLAVVQRRPEAKTGPVKQLKKTVSQINKKTKLRLRIDQRQML